MRSTTRPIEGGAGMSLESRVQRLRNELAALRPIGLWQDIHDINGYDGYLERIWNREARSSDWGRYAEDARFGDQGQFQADLFGYALPDLLADWEERADNFDRDQITFVLLNKLESSIDRHGQKSVGRFFSDGLIERFDHVRSFTQCGWLDHWSLAARLPETMARALPPLIEAETPGRAVALLQFASCLVFPEYDNPILGSHSPRDGGGPPDLWQPPGESDAGWEASNLEAFDGHITPAALLEAAILAAERVPPSEITVARHFNEVSEAMHERLLRRWPLLRRLLAAPNDDEAYEGWVEFDPRLPW